MPLPVQFVLANLSTKLMFVTALHVSVAVQVRRIVALPVQLVRSKASVKVRLAMPLHASVAVAAPVLLVVGSTVHSSTRSAGQVRTGGVVSLTITSVVQRLEQLLLMT